MAKAFNLTAQINLRGPGNLKPVVAQIRRELGSVSADVKVNVSAGAIKSVDAVTSKLKAMNAVIVQARQNTESLSSTFRTLSSSLGSVQSDTTKAAAGITKTASSAATAAKTVKQAGTAMEEFGKQSFLAIKRFAAFSFVTAGIFSLTNAISSGFRAFISFDKELVKLQQVTGKGAIGIASLEKEITRLATTLGVSSESLASVASTLAQAGLSADETRIALEALAKTELAPSFDNLKDTTEGAIAAIRQFSLEAGQLESALGSINAVAAAFAVESKDIIAAIQRTGGVFASASKGVSEGTDALNEFIAIFTSVRQTTRESAETIATGLRTIFTRIQRGSTIQQLKEFGITLTDLEGKFVGPFEAIKRLSEGLSQLDPRDLRFSQIIEELGGFRQIGKVIPLIQQFAVAQQALKVAQKGQGSLTEAQIVAQQSLANQLAKVREQFLALIRDVGKSTVFQGLFKVVTGLASAMISLAGAFKPILPILSIMAAVKGVSAISQFATGFFGGLSKGGGARAVGENVGASASGAKEKERTEATNRASQAISENTGAIKTLTTAINSLTTRVDANTNALNNRGSSTLKSGGKVLGFNKGGLVPGYGGGDKVPALLEGGEVVINKQAVRKYGAGNLVRMNKYVNGGKIKAKIGELPSQSKIEYGKIRGLTSKDKAGEVESNIVPSPVVIPEQDFPYLIRYIADEFRANKYRFIKFRDQNAIGPEGDTPEFIYGRKSLPIQNNNISQPYVSLPPPNGANWAKGRAFERYLEDKYPIQTQSSRTKVTDSSTFPDIIVDHFAPLDFDAGDAKFEKTPEKYFSTTNQESKVILSKRFRSEQKRLPWTQKVDSFINNRALPDTTVFYPDDPERTKTSFDSFYAQQYKLAVSEIAQTAEAARQFSIGRSLNSGGKVRFNLGGFVQKFIGGGKVKEMAEAKGMSIQDFILEQVKALGGPGKVKEILGIPQGARELNSLFKSSNLQLGRNIEEASEYLEKALEKKGGIDVAEQERIAKLKKVAVAGLVPIGYNKNFEWDIDGNRTVYANVRGFSSIYEQVVAKMQQESQDLKSRFAENLQYASIFDGGQLAFDFDDTLVKGADIRGPDGQIDVSKYYDRDLVKASLSKGVLTRLGTKLKSLIDIEPDFIKQTRILTARPQSTADLLADALQRLGLPYTSGDIKGVGQDVGAGQLFGSVASAKAANVAATEKLIDDNIENYTATIKAKKKGFLYSEPTPIPEISEILGQGNIEGAIIEAALTELGANLPPLDQLEQNRALDFPLGLGRAAQFFGIDPNIPTEVKRTLDGNAFTRARAEFGRYFQENPDKYNSGGLVQRFMLGGTGKAPRKVDFERGVGASPFIASKQQKLGQEIYDLEKNSGFSSREFDALVYEAKTNDFSLEEFKQFLKQRLAQKKAKANLRMNPIDVLRAMTPDSSYISQKQNDLARSLMGDTDAQYNPKYDNALRRASGGTLIDSSLAETTAAYAMRREKELEGKEKKYGQIRLKQDASTISASYEGGNGSGYVNAYKMRDYLYYVGLSKATKGYGPRLYDVVMEAATSAGAMLTSDRSSVSGAAKKVWEYYFKNRSDVKKTPLKPDDWTRNQAEIDPKLYGKEETWPPATDPAWILQSGYSKSPSLINDPNSVIRNDRKLDSHLMALQYFQKAAEGGYIGNFAEGGSIPARVSNGEAFVPPKLAKKIGYGKLNKLNQADRNGISSFSDGGISIFKGPGSGTSDSISTSLPVGGYVIREKATKALGLHSGGVVGKVSSFKVGGVSTKDAVRAQGQILSSVDEAASTLSEIFSQLPMQMRDILIKKFKGIRAYQPGQNFIKGDSSTAFNDKTRGKVVNTRNMAAMGLKITGKEGGATTETVAHEAGHMVDAELGRGLKSGSVASELPDTFQFKLVEKARQVMEEEYKKSGKYSEDTTEYLLSGRELFAEMFAKASPAVRAILASTTDAEEGMKLLAQEIGDVGHIYGGLQISDFDMSSAAATQAATKPQTTSTTPTLPSGGLREVFGAIDESGSASTIATVTTTTKPQTTSASAPSGVPPCVPPIVPPCVPPDGDSPDPPDDDPKKRKRKEKPSQDGRLSQEERKKRKEAYTAQSRAGGLTREERYREEQAKKRQQQNFADQEFIKYKAAQTGTSAAGVKLDIAQKLGRATYEADTLFTGKTQEASTKLVTRRDEAMKAKSAQTKAIEQADAARKVLSDTGASDKDKEKAKSQLAAADLQLSEANKRLQAETEAVLQQMIELRPDLAGTAKGMDRLKAASEKVANELGSGDLSTAQSSFQAGVAGSEKGGKLSDKERSALARIQVSRETGFDTGLIEREFEGSGSSAKLAKRQAFIQSREGQRFGALASLAPGMVEGFSKTKLGGALGVGADFVSGKGGRLSKAFAGAGGFTGIGMGLAAGTETLKQFLPKTMTSDPNTAGALGALSGAGTGAAAGAQLGSLAGPIGTLVGGVGGAIIGGIDGWFSAKNQAILTNALENIAKSSGDLDQAFKKLDAEASAVNLSSAQKAFGNVLQAGTKISDIALSEPASITGAATSGYAVGGALSGAAIGAAVGSIVPILGTALGAAIGGAVGYAGGAIADYRSKPSAAEREEALKTMIGGASQNQEAATRLAEVQLNSKSTDEVSKIFDNLKNGTGELNPIVDQYVQSALAAAKSQGITNQKELESIGVEAQARASLDAYMKKRKESGATDEQISKEISSNREAAIKEGEQANRQAAELLTKQNLLAKATKAVAVATENLLDVYRRVGAGAQRFSDEIDDMLSSSQSTIDSFAGKAENRKVDRGGSERVLGNISAYSAEEVKAATQDVVSKLGGGEEAQKLGKQAEAAKFLQDKLPAMLRAQNADPTKIIDDLKLGLQNDIGLDPSVVKTMLDDIEIKIRNNKDGTLASEIEQGGIGSISSASQEALKTLQNLSKTYNDTLQKSIDLQNQYNQVIMQSNEYMRKAGSIRITAELDLARALGNSPTLAQLNEPFDFEIRDLTKGLTPGGTTDPAAIAAGIAGKIAENTQLEEANKGINRSVGADGQAAADNLKSQQANNAAIGKNVIAINEGRQALERLASDGTKAANALAKIEEQQRQIEGLGNRFEKIFTAGPEELFDMTRKSLALQAAGQAGPEWFKSRTNRQDAFAGLEQDKEFLTPQEYRTQRAMLMRKSFESQGLTGQSMINKGGVEMTLDEFLKRIEGGMPNEEDPNVKAYRDAVNTQIAANKELASLNELQALIIQDSMVELQEFLKTEFPKILTNAVTASREASATKPEVGPTESSKKREKTEADINKDKKEKAQLDTEISNIDSQIAAEEKKRYIDQDPGLIADLKYAKRVKESRRKDLNFTISQKEKTLTEDKKAEETENLAIKEKQDQEIKNKEKEATKPEIVSEDRRKTKEAIAKNRADRQEREKKREEENVKAQTAQAAQPSNTTSTTSSYTSVQAAKMGSAAKPQRDITELSEQELKDNIKRLRARKGGVKGSTEFAQTLNTLRYKVGEKNERRALGEALPGYKKMVEAGTMSQEDFDAKQARYQELKNRAAAEAEEAKKQAEVQAQEQQASSPQVSSNQKPVELPADVNLDADRKAFEEEKKAQEDKKFSAWQNRNQAQKEAWDADTAYNNAQRYTQEEIDAGLWDGGNIIYNDPAKMARQEELKKKREARIADARKNKEDADRKAAESQTNYTQVETNQAQWTQDNAVREDSLKQREEAERKRKQLERDRELVATGQFGVIDSFDASQAMYGHGGSTSYMKLANEDKALKEKISRGETLTSEEQAKYDEYRSKEKKYYDNRRAQAQANVQATGGLPEGYSQPTTTNAGMTGASSSRPMPPQPKPGSGPVVSTPAPIQAPPVVSPTAVSASSPQQPASPTSAQIISISSESLTKLDNFNKNFDSYVTRLEQLEFKPIQHSVEIKMDPIQVQITGAAAMEGLSKEMKSVAEGLIIPKIKEIEAKIKKSIPDYQTSDTTGQKPNR